MITTTPKTPSPRTRRPVFPAAAVLLLAAAAAEPAGQVEITAYWTRFHPRLDTTYVHTFTPPFESPPAFVSGTGGQDLTLRTDRASGWSLNLNIGLGGRVGLQALFSTFTTVLGGTSTPYVVAVEYDARQPPDYVLRRYAYSRTDDWPAPVGEIDQFNLSVNALIEFDLVAGLEARVSAGPTYFSFAGRAGPVGYTQFRLGGHSVLYSETSSLEMNVARTVRLGANAGAELIFWVLRGIGLGVETRYFLAPEAEAPVTFAVQDESGTLWPVDTAAIEAVPLIIDPSFFRLAFGFKVRL